MVWAPEVRNRVFDILVLLFIEKPSNRHADTRVCYAGSVQKKGGTRRWIYTRQNIAPGAKFLA